MIRKWSQSGCYSDRKVKFAICWFQIRLVPLSVYRRETGLDPVYTKHRHQRCDNSGNVSNILPIENNGVTRKWVTTQFWSNSIITARKRSLRRGNVLHASVILSGGCLCPGEISVRERAVRILLECILVWNENSITSIFAKLSQHWLWHFV